MLKSDLKKQPRRYRLGTTSYIYPTDVLPNVKKLAGKVDDVELVLFEYKNISNLPTPENIKQMKQLAERENLTFTVHLPLDLSIGDFNVSVRNQSLNKAKSLIKLTNSLNPLGYIIHPDRWTPDAKNEIFPLQHLKNKRFTLGQLNNEDKQRINYWVDKVLEGLHTLKPIVAENSTLCVENTNFLFDYLFPSLLKSPFGICLDVGHLLQSDLEIMPYLRRYVEKLQIIHLHGVSNGKDHQRLTKEMHPQLKQLFNYLKQNDYKGVVTLEVFSEEDLLHSFQVLKEVCL